MPKSKTRKPKQKPGNKLRFTFEESRLAALSKKFEADTTLPPKALEDFRRILTLYGLGLWQEFSISATLSESYLSRFTVFGPDDEHGWTIKEQRCALKCLGFTNLNQIGQELNSLAKEDAAPTVSAYFLTLPRLAGIPFIVLCLLNDESSNRVTAVLTGDGYHFLPESEFYLDAMLQSASDIGADVLSEYYFRDAAGYLMHGLPKPVGELSAAELGAELQDIARYMADALLKGQCMLLDAFRHTMNDMVDTHREQRDQAAHEAAALQAKTVRKLTGQLEKTEMMFKGSQARAQKLEAELRELKRQSNGMPAGNGPAPALASSLPHLLDQVLAYRH